MSVVLIGYADKPAEDVFRMYHAKSDQGKAFRSEFDGACVIMNALIEAGKLPMLLPQSHVTCEKAFMVTTGYKLAFLTEADCNRIFGCGPKQLKLGKPCTIRLEDGSGTVHGWYMSMSGMRWEDAAGLRKVKVSTLLSINHTDELMSPATHVRANQAQDILALALNQQQQSRPTAERCAGPKCTCCMSCQYVIIVQRLI